MATKSKNSIISLLNEAGYKNEGSNRERAIRNLNLLIDSGIISFEFIRAEAYADLTPGKPGTAFRFKTDSGKVCTTAYMVTVFGKRFYGQFIPRIIRTNLGMGFGISEEVADNSRLDIFAIMLRVSRLLSILRKKEEGQGSGDFLKARLSAAHGDCSCGKCSGRGIIPAFAHYANGVCFDCGGTGINRDTLKASIKEAVEFFARPSASAPTKN